MKILILSDSHSFRNALEEILKNERSADMIIHLGDGGSDLFEMTEYTAGKPVYNIKGNCDLSAFSFTERLITYAEDVKFLACHGHMYHVKTTLHSLFYAAKEQDCKVALFGHTHIPHIEDYEGITLFNPGSVASFRYGIMEVKKDKLTLTHKKL